MRGQKKTSESQRAINRKRPRPEDGASGNHLVCHTPPIGEKGASPRKRGRPARPRAISPLSRTNGSTGTHGPDGGVGRNRLVLAAKTGGEPVRSPVREFGHCVRLREKRFSAASPRVAGPVA